jgi:hypothetical protein
MAIEKTSIAALPVGEKAELEQLLATPVSPDGSTGYLQDNDDIAALWLFTGAAGCGGIGVYFGGPLPFPFGYAAAAAGAALLAWTVWTFATTFRKRGVLFTSFGTWRRVGNSLRGMRHADVASVLWHTVHRKRSGNFTVVELISSDQQKLTLYAHRGWVQRAIDAMQKARGGQVQVREE